MTIKSIKNFFRNPPFYYGWVIVGIATLALIISNGLAILGLPVFYKPIQEDLIGIGAITSGNADAVTGYAASLTSLLAGVFSLVVSIFVKRFGVKDLMIGGCVVLGSALLIYSRAETASMIYIAHSLLGLALGLVGVTIQSVLVSNWFQARRGIALGIVLTGTSLGGVIVSQIAPPLIRVYGWRQALLLLSMSVWLLLLPAIIFLVRESASDEGLQFNEFVSGPSDVEEVSAVRSGATLAQAIRTAGFWLLAMSAAALFYTIFSTSQQFILHIQKSASISASPELAKNAQSALLLMSLTGKFFFGALSDHFPIRRVMFACCLIMFTSTVVFLGFLNVNTLWLYVVCFGFGYGGTFVLIQLLAARMFGLRDLARILGALTLIETIGGFIGTNITGMLASANGGDYTSAFYGVTMAAGIALVCVVILNLKVMMPREKNVT